MVSEAVSAAEENVRGVFKEGWGGHISGDILNRA